MAAPLRRYSYRVSSDASRERLLMSPKTPRRPPAPPSKEERLAKALRENLARRKALARAKRARENEGATLSAAPSPRTPGRANIPDHEDEASS